MNNMINYDNSDDSKKEEIILIETVLSSFIPFFNHVISAKMNNQEEKVESLNNIIVMIDSMNITKKKKKAFYKTNLTIKKEEKEFLYKLYFSSSDTNQNTMKMISEDTLKITVLSSQIIRSILILLRDEICSSGQGKMISKLKQVKTIMISETKNFSFKVLFLTFEFLLLHFCKNVNEIIIDKIASSRPEQIDSIIKKGIYLHYIVRAKNIVKITSINKIEFLNENVIFNILYEYISKNEIKEISPEQIEINNINLIDVMLYQQNLERIELKRITIDKIKMIEQIICVIRNNRSLKEICIDKFISIPENYTKDFYQELEKLSFGNLYKLKLCIASSSINDLSFLNLLQGASSIQKMILKLQRVIIEEDSLNQYLQKIQKNKNIKKLSFIAEKINLRKTNSLLFSMIPLHLKQLTLGLVDHLVLEAIKKAIDKACFFPKLDELKLIFVSINEENYDESYKDLISIIANGKMIKKIVCLNYLLKYRSILDEEIKKALMHNTVLKTLLVQSDKYYKTQTISGVYYYEFPMFIISPLLFAFKKNKTLCKLYYKKTIINQIFQFFRIKKEKNITLSFI